MAHRLMTTWWRTSGSSDQLGGWLDRYLSPVSGFTIRRYHVEGAADELLSWIEDTGGFESDLSDIQTVLSSAPASKEGFAFDLVRDVGMPPTPATPWLYIVHTDIPPEIVTDYNAWYDEEHLPRLVTVPGVVRARRYVADEGVSPRYLTAYDLSIRDAFESPEGLKARKTSPQDVQTCNLIQFSKADAVVRPRVQFVVPNRAGHGRETLWESDHAEIAPRDRAGAVLDAWSTECSRRISG